MKKLIFVPILVLIDFLTKFYFKDKSVINTGIAFGTFQGNNLLWIIVSLVVIGILIYLYKTEKEHRTGLILVISGATGNLIDRIIYNGVLDFINLGFWPAFNLADVFNTVGVIVIILKGWKK